MNMVS